MRYLGRLNFLLGRPRSWVPLGRRAARAAKKLRPNPALHRARPSILNLVCPISMSVVAAAVVATKTMAAAVVVWVVVRPHCFVRLTCRGAPKNGLLQQNGNCQKDLIKTNHLLHLIKARINRITATGHICTTGFLGLCSSLTFQFFVRLSRLIA